MQPDENIYIYGKNAVEEALESDQSVEKIYIRQNLPDSNFASIITLASGHRVPVSHVPGNKLYGYVGKVNDQGIVALMSAVTYHDFDEWIEEVNIDTYPGILLLNEIEDPGNLGAILRTAAAAGLEAVIVPKHRQAPVTPLVFKTSAGTAGRIPIVRVGNLNQAILKLKDIGFWIAGLEMAGERSLWELEIDRPLAFVIGNESSGIRKKTLEHCDYTFKIPMQNNVESLNASVSAALVCYEWARKKGGD